MFTQVDAADRARPFAFSVKVLPDNSYEGERCAVPCCGCEGCVGVVCRGREEGEREEGGTEGTALLGCWLVVAHFQLSTGWRAPHPNTHTHLKKHKKITKKVTGCDPEPPELAAMSARLAADRDFAGFVRSMRRAFKALCAAERGGDGGDAATD